jgi:adenosine deaminase
MARLARDRILVECCPTSNYQTGAVAPGEPHPIFRFLERGIPVAVCTDNTTVSGTDQNQESRLLARTIGLDGVTKIHRDAAAYSFIRGYRVERETEIDETG